MVCFCASSGPWPNPSEGPFGARCRRFLASPSPAQRCHSHPTTEEVIGQMTLIAVVKGAR